MRAEEQQIHVSRAQRTLPSQAITCRRLALPSEIISQSYVPKVDTAIIRTSIRKLQARILGEVRSRAKRPHFAATAVGLSTGLPGRTSYVIPSRARHVGTEADWVGGKQLRLAGQLREVAAGRRWNHGCSAVTPAGRAITSRVGWAGDNLVREGLDAFVRVSGWANVRWRTPILRSSPPQAVLFAGLCECHRAAPSGSSGTQDTARDGERLRRRPVICDRPGHEQRLDGGG
jgi:hypothetical protein